MFGLFLAVASFLVPSFPSALLCFYYFFSWILWNIAAWGEISKGAYIRLGLLWIAIDFSILICFLSAVHSLGDVTNTQGSEMIWGIAYLPSILPLGLILDFGSNATNSGSNQFILNAKTLLGPALGNAVGNWLLISAVSVCQCIVVGYLMFIIRRIKYNRMTS